MNYISSSERNIPIYYDEDINVWYFTVYGKRVERSSLKTAKAALDFYPEAVRRETMEPVFALLTRDNFIDNGKCIPVGTRCEIVSVQYGSSFCVRGLGQYTQMSKDDLVADTPENREQLRQWMMIQKAFESHPHIWEFAKTLTQVEVT